MKLLMDTHMLIWAAAGTLPEEARALAVDNDNEIYFSPASIWEVGIKNSLGRKDFEVDPTLLRRTLLDHLYEELPITSLHVLATCDLPAIHKDPFGRMILAQAKSEGIALVTSDGLMKKYRVPIIFIPRKP